MRWIVVLAYLAVMLGGSMPIAPNGQTATVHVRPVAEYGAPLRHVEADLFNLKEGRSYSDHLRGLDAEGLPRGVYKVTVRSRGFWTFEKTVGLWAAEQWLMAGIRVDPLDVPVRDRSFEVRLKPVPTDSRRVWVRLLGLYVEGSRDSVPDASGVAWFRGVPGGTYVLVVLENEKVLQIKPIEVKFQTDPIDVSLDSP